MRAVWNGPPAHERLDGRDLDDDENDQGGRFRCDCFAITASSGYAAARDSDFELSCAMVESTTKRHASQQFHSRLVQPVHLGDHWRRFGISVHVRGPSRKSLPRQRVPACDEPGPLCQHGLRPDLHDSNHTTASCKSQSATVAGNAGQQAAWAVGCSEAQGDYGYATSQGISSALAWWLDVETANSWCSPTGPNCTDLTLNQYTIQGLIDTFTHIGAVPVGIYSNTAMWTAITGSFQPTGASMDWYASGTTTAQTAKAYCSNTNSFSGAPVTIVQFVPNSSTDRDYAC